MKIHYLDLKSTTHQLWDRSEGGGSDGHLDGDKSYTCGFPRCRRRADRRQHVAIANDPTAPCAPLESRRRQARNLIRSYRHLIADDILGPSSASLNSNNEKESSQNANADQTAVRTGSRANNA